MQFISMKRRPVWVWLIVIFFFLVSLATLASFLGIRSGAIEINESKRAYIDGLSTIDYAASLLLTCLNLLAAVLLFRLRKEALYLFVCALVLNVLLTTWHVFTKGLAAVASGGLTTIVLGFGLPCLICYYTWRLKSKQVLV